MTTENHPIDQLFREKLGSFEQNPPVDLLDQINQQVVFRNRVRKINQIKTYIGIAAAMVLILMAGWYSVSLNEFSENKAPVKSQKEVAPIQKNIASAPGISKEQKNQLLAWQQNSGKSAVATNVRQKIKQPVKPNNATPASAKNNDAATQVSVSSGEVATNNAVTQQNTTTEAKDETKPDTKLDKNQKKSEPRYFTNSQFNPAASSNKEVKTSWGIKAEVSPMFASQNQVGGTNGSTNSKSMNTVSGGMIASLKVSKRVSISSGIRYSHMSQNTHSDYYMNKTSGIVYLQPVEKSANISRDVSLNLPSISSIVYSNGMKPANATSFASDISQEFKYLEVPIQATYKLIDNKLSFGLTGGISTNILVGNYASITENGIKLSSGDTDNLRNVIYSGAAGLEFGYDLGNRLVLTVEPRVKQYMHSVSSNELINFKPLQVGIFTGITYSFN